MTEGRNANEIQIEYLKEDFKNLQKQFDQFKEKVERDYVLKIEAKPFFGGMKLVATTFAVILATAIANFFIRSRS